jgi:hypothetical protein
MIEDDMARACREYYQIAKIADMTGDVALYKQCKAVSDFYFDAIVETRQMLDELPLRQNTQNTHLWVQ